ncbi:hypothetical protein GCM10027360_26530 [Amycolatopsis echigonensis]
MRRDAFRGDCHGQGQVPAPVEHVARGLGFLVDPHADYVPQEPKRIVRGKGVDAELRRSRSYGKPGEDAPRGHQHHACRVARQERPDLF